MRIYATLIVQCQDGVTINRQTTIVRLDLNMQTRKIDTLCSDTT